MSKKLFNVHKIISYGSNNTTVQVIVNNKTKHLKLVNGLWTCNNGHKYNL